MKERLAAILSLALVVLLATLVVLRRGDIPETPEAVLHRAFDLAERGNLDAYLRCFTGVLREDLDAARRESGEEFRAGLQRRAEALAGIAVSRPSDATEQPDDERILLVELVFRDRTEKQVYRFTREKGRWRIAEIGTASTVRMPIPYGTSVIPDDITAPGEPPPES